jgi:sterol desaturase/sphingolipid hydroxylase (fatty acid hydroxylase superfamily)
VTSTDLSLGGDITLLAPFFSASSRTYWFYLLTAALVAIGVTAWQLRKTPAEIGLTLRRGVSPKIWLSGSSLLDIKLLALRVLSAMLGLLPEVAGAWVLATGLVKNLDRVVGMPTPPDWSTATVSAVYTLVLFIAWDLSRYLVHRLMHAVPLLWRFHQVHHSATVLTPLTFFRVHPVESLVMHMRGIVTTGLVAGLAYWVFRQQATMMTFMGVHVLLLGLNALFGNLRHSHVWLSFGPTIERWLISPAQHQLHHGTTAALQNCNYGTWLGVWDRLGGSLLVATERLTVVGLDESNHDPTRLDSALFGPFKRA